MGIHHFIFYPKIIKDGRSESRTGSMTISVIQFIDFFNSQDIHQSPGKSVARTSPE